MTSRKPIKSKCSIEWLVALVPAILVGVVYVVSIPPSVPMNSGAYVTAAFDFGVPINPGYPLWTLSGFLWSHFVLPVGNPSWRLSMMSVASGAFLAGVMALMMKRSVLWLIRDLPWGKAVEPQQNLIATTVGISTALMFGFDRAVWKFACTPEPQAFYTLLYFLAVVSFFSWFRQPRRRGFFYTTILLLSLTVATSDMNGWQASVVMTIPFVLAVSVIGFEKFIAAHRHDTVSEEQKGQRTNNKRCEQEPDGDGLKPAP